MSESMRIARRRNVMVFTNRQDAPTYKQRNVGSYEIYNLIQEGEVEAGLPVETPAPTPGIYNLSAELLRCVDNILISAATRNLGPTRSSRLYYIWFFSVATAYQWVRREKRTTGTKDSWNWDSQFPLELESDLCIWMLLCLETIHSTMGIAYVAPWNDLANTYLLSDAQLAIAKTTVQAAAQYNVWSTAFSTWYTSRAADGSVAAAVPPVDADLPNGSTRLDVALTVDPSSFASPESWTPLKIGTASQKYLTYNWNNVTSPCLTTDNQTSIYSAADAYYPTNAERESEIAEVVSITNGLTDTGKVIAEFWAGGPFTVSPPGMMIWMWKYYVSNKFSDPATFIWSGLDLSLHLFEMGRIVWGLKKAHMEARPIQEIRRLYRGQSVNKYDGTPILGESWVPYQETDFVTPPFADFPSGHSAFSRSFANVMTAWFGPAIDGIKQISFNDISLISPALKPQTKQFGTFLFDTGDSLIQKGVVPAEPVTLSWSTWSDLAESAGISRKYGGIHATSAHTGSVAAADALHTAVNTNFPIAIGSV